MLAVKNKLGISQQQMCKIKIAFKNKKQMEDSDMFMGRKMRIECNSSSCTELNKLIPTNFMKEQRNQKQPASFEESNLPYQICSNNQNPVEWSKAR